MRCDLIVKLLFVAAEPAHFYFSITLSLPRLAAQRFDPRFIAEIFARLTVTRCNSLFLQAERNGLFQHYPLYYLDLACTLASWLAQARRTWSGTLLTGVLLLVTLRRLELTISGLRGQLPVQLEDRAIILHQDLEKYPIQRYLQQLPTQKQKRVHQIEFEYQNR